MARMSLDTAIRLSAEVKGGEADGVRAVQNRMQSGMMGRNHVA